MVAPIDGVVTELGVREGAAFMAGASLFRINGLATVWVNAQIPESRVSMVPLESTVEAHATAWPGTTFKGRVIAFLPQVDPQTRTLTVRIALDNPDFQLSPGMWVALDFTAPASEPQLVVPSEAVIVTGERSLVIVAGEKGSFDVVNVSTGVEQDGRTPILSGLKEGQSIVLSGQFLIDSEASLTSTVNRPEDDCRLVHGAAGGRAMIARLIRWSIQNRFLVLLATVMLVAWGIWAMLRIPLDAIPDLSDVQVIIRTTYPGSGAADRRESGHLSARHHHAFGARRENGARLFDVRVIRTSTSCSTMARISTGRARGCSST